MVDYQYLPDMNDPVSQLRLAMDKMDGASPLCWCPCNMPTPIRSVDAITAYRMPLERNYEPIAGSGSGQEGFEMHLDPELAATSTSAAATPASGSSNLRLFPPPLFSRQTISQNYKYVIWTLLFFLLLTFAFQLQGESRVNRHHNDRRGNRGRA